MSVLETLRRRAALAGAGFVVMGAMVERQGARAARDLALAVRT